MSSIWTERDVEAQLQFIQLRSHYPSKQVIVFFMIFNILCTDQVTVWSLFITGIWTMEVLKRLLLASIYESESISQ